MKQSLIGLSAILALCLSVNSFAVDSDNCHRPDAPALPDADTAGEAELIAAQQEVKSFNADGEGYLGCLKTAEEALTEDATDEERQAMVTLYNAMVDDMHSIADQFNQAVRAYKARAQ